MMKQIFSYGPVFLTSAVIIITLILLTGAGVFFPSIWAYIGQAHIFEAVTVTVLLEVLFFQLRISGELGSKKVTNYAQKETFFHERLMDSISHDRPRCVQMFSSSLWSREELIAEFMKLGIEVRIILPGKTTRREKSDGKSAEAVIGRLLQDTPSECHRFLLIRRADSPASIRSIVVLRDRMEICEGVVSWYTYNNGNRAIGHSHPAIYLPQRSMDAFCLTKFLIDEFEKTWGDARTSPIVPVVNPA